MISTPVPAAYPWAARRGRERCFASPARRRCATPATNRHHHSNGPPNTAHGDPFATKLYRTSASTLPAVEGQAEGLRDAGADPAEKPRTFFRLTAVFDTLSRDRRQRARPCRSNPLSRRIRRLRRDRRRATSPCRVAPSIRAESTLSVCRRVPELSWCS